MTGREDLERVVAEAIEDVELIAVGHGIEPTTADLATHVAAVIAPLIEQARRDGAVEGYARAVSEFHEAHPDHCGGECFRASANPYRAERATENAQEAPGTPDRGQVAPGATDDLAGPQIGGER